AAAPPTATPRMMPGAANVATTRLAAYRGVNVLKRWHRASGSVQRLPPLGRDSANRRAHLGDFGHDWRGYRLPRIGHKRAHLTERPNDDEIGEQAEEVVKQVVGHPAQRPGEPVDVRALEPRQPLDKLVGDGSREDARAEQGENSLLPPAERPLARRALLLRP